MFKTKTTLLAAAGLLATSAAFADAVSGDSSNVGTLSVGSATSLSELETNAGTSTAYAGDAWFFTLPLNGFGATGTAAPLNLTLTLPGVGSFPALQSGVQSIDLFHAAGGNALVGPAISTVGVPAGSSPSDPLSFTFTGLTPATDYALVLHYSVGAGVSGGYNAAIIATVPEPETYGMMALGLGVLGFIGRRRKQKQA